MKLQHIDLGQLKLSGLNVRRHGAEEELPALIASIRSLGVIQPLLVRPNCEGFEVIAGQRRLLACQAIAAETGAADPVPCAVLEDGDNALALEASLAENIARLPMDEIDQYEAFAALKTEGRTIENIAAQFGVTELLVKRRLAIAALLPAVLEAYRGGHVEGECIRLLTMATPRQQKAWLKLFQKDEAPTGYRLKAWLFGGAEIPVSSALFPVERYPGGIVADLFAEERYFDNADRFWKLQTEAVMEKQAAYLDAGWSDVVVMEIGKTFYSYDKVKRPKTKGGKVYIASASNGEVSFHEGWLDEKEAARRDKALARAQDSEREADASLAADRPELTGAAQRYLDLHRQNAVRAELLKAPGLALRLTVASIIGCASSWTVKPETQSANGNHATASSLDNSPATTIYRDELKAIRGLIGCPGDGYLCAGDFRTDGTKLLARLLSLSDEDVLRVLTLLMAESLAAGSAATEAAGQLLAVDMGKWWSPDEAFFSLLRDRPALQAMIAEVAGKQAASFSLKETAKAQVDVLRHCLAGTGGQKKAAPWMPRYLRFPMQSYTKRRGIAAIERGNAVRKLIERKR